MRTDRSGERIACARCRANNFVGQAQCWQCGHSLPPPEMVAAAVQSAPTPGRPAAAPVRPVSLPASAPQVRVPPMMPPHPVPAYAAGRQTGRGKMPIILSIALLTAAVVVVFVARKHAAPASVAAQMSQSSARDLNNLNAQAQGMSQSGLPDSNGVRLSMPARDSLPPSADPNEQAARRAIENAIPRLGLPPQASPDNSVHLQNGDTISRDQYEETRRKLQEHPLFGGQPPVPRL